MIYAGLVAALFVAMTAGVAYGSVDVPLQVVWPIALHHVFGFGDPSGWTQTQDGIVWELRVPRVLLGVLVGAGLAVVGVAAQALVRNPLADPYLLGISSGASVGAVSVLVLGISIGGVAATSAAAFTGALVTFLNVYLLARRGGSFAPSRLVLAGVAVGYALSGITSYLVLQADDPGKTNSVLFWLLGSLAAARWADLGVPMLALLAGLVIVLARARSLNALLVGDETAAGLGVAPNQLRRELFATTSFVTGVMVSLSGGIGFVGRRDPGREPGP